MEDEAETHESVTGRDREFRHDVAGAGHEFLVESLHLVSVIFREKNRLKKKKFNETKRNEVLTDRD